MIAGDNRAWCTCRLALGPGNAPRLTVVGLFNQCFAGSEQVAARKVRQIEQSILGFEIGLHCAILEHMSQVEAGGP